MSMIIAGGFETITDAEAAVARLMELGVSRDHMCKYRVNPAGEHNALPAGGDHDASPGATHAHGGAVKGAAIGAAVGLAAGAAATPMLGPAGIAAETLLAVNADQATIPEADIVRTFEECGALQVERAYGEWLDGEWTDFDPLLPPNLIGGREKDAPRPTA
jgi:hypothetical protein